MNHFPELASVEAWLAASSQRREALCDAILGGLPKHFQRAAPFISSHRGERWEIPCFYDALHETALNLVIGGSFDYGAPRGYAQKVRKLCTDEEWRVLEEVIAAARPGAKKEVPAFLMARFPLFDRVAEEQVQLSRALERPDFSDEEGPVPIYLSADEAAAFLAKTGYRLPWDVEWEYVAKENKASMFIGAQDLATLEQDPQSVFICSFGDAEQNRRASNSFGIAGLALAAMTLAEGSPQPMVRGGAAAFYPFQGPAEWAMLLTEIGFPLQDMPGDVAGVRLCLDLPLP